MPPGTDKPWTAQLTGGTRRYETSDSYTYHHATLKVCHTSNSHEKKLYVSYKAYALVLWICVTVSRVVDFKRGKTRCMVPIASRFTNPIHQFMLLSCLATCVSETMLGTAGISCSFAFK